MPKRALAITAVLVTTSALVPPPRAKAKTDPPTPPVPVLDDTLASLELPPRPPVAEPPPAPALAAPPGPTVGEQASARGQQGAGGGRNAANRPGRGARSGGALARIRACESGSDYQARSASGRYRGAYQMDRATFASVGGSGDPAAASPAEQDRRARLLYQQRGGQPWPVCAGRA
ncbi:MAG: transglycosylase family protein [Actinomycetota bacterium]|nr:transglycosylase family protein [Actinomycetota bacterium]